MNMPPAGFFFKLADNANAFYCRPVLKLKRIYSDFDGIPTFKEQPFKSFLDLKQDDVDYEEVESPQIRKKKQQQDMRKKKEDLVETFFAFLKQQSKKQQNIVIHKVQWIKTLSIRNGTIEVLEQKMRYKYKMSNVQNRFIQNPLIQQQQFVKHASPNTRPLIKEWLISDIQKIYRRRYLQKKSCLQIILHDGQHLLFNFTKGYENLMEELFKFKESIRPIEQTPDFNLEKSKKTQKWINGEISNLEYLMYLNLLGHRSFKDLTQYPVVPWALKKYSGEKIDLKKKEIYRDLTKPMGACGSPERELAYHEKFYNTDLSQEGVPPFHYGSHYSNPGIVMHFLIRMQPYSRGAKELQSGKWDIPDRLFHSVREVYFNATHEMSDVRELIPEAYYLPEMFLNLEKYDFGSMQTGEVVNSVVLPKWCQGCPYLFTQMNRQALESPHVSGHLNFWIDLIFGYLQRGKEAEKNLNQFYYLTYEDSVQIDLIEDISKLCLKPIYVDLRKSIESQIMHFGQTPTQVLTKPHPKKLVQKLITVNYHHFLLLQVFHQESSLYYLTYTNVTAMIIEEPKIIDKLMNVFQQQSEKKVQKQQKVNRQKKIMLVAQMDNDRMIVIRKYGEIDIIKMFNQERKVEFSNERQFKLSFDHQDGELRLKFDPEDSFKKQIVCFLPLHRLILLGGAWDGRLEMFSVDWQRKLQTYWNHYGRISVIHVDSKERFVVTGCVNGQVILWRFEGNKNSLRAVSAFQDHFEGICDIDISRDLKLFVSASKEGRMNLYNIYNQKYVRSYFHKAVVDKIKLVQCPLCCIVFYCSDEDMIYTVSINGQWLQKLQLNHKIVSPLYLAKHLNFDEYLVRVLDLF